MQLLVQFVFFFLLVMPAKKVIQGGSECRKPTRKRYTQRDTSDIIQKTPCETLEDLISQQRRNLEIVDTKQQDAELAELKKLRELYASPLEASKAQEIDARIAALQAEIAEIKNGKQRKDVFDRVAAYYMKRMQNAKRRNMEAAVSRGKRRRVLQKGITKVIIEAMPCKEDQFDMPHKDAGLKDVHNEILEDFQHAFDGSYKAKPRMVEVDVCEDCGVQMETGANSAMLVCPVCNVGRYSMLSTTSYMPVTEKADKPTVIQKKEKSVEHQIDALLMTRQGKEKGEPEARMLQEVCRLLVEHEATGIEKYAAELAEYGPFNDYEDLMRKLPRELAEPIDACLQQLTYSSLVGWVGAARSNLSPAKCNKKQEYIAKIAAYLSGLWPRRLTMKMEAQIRLMKRVATPAYNLLREPGKKIFFNGYPHFLRRVFALLGLYEFLLDNDYPLPQSKDLAARDKRIQRVWEQQLTWEPLPMDGETPLKPIVFAGPKGDRQIEMHVPYMRPKKKKPTKKGAKKKGVVDTGK